MDKNYSRHVKFYGILRFLVSPIFRLMFAYTPKKAPAIEGAYIVLSNHNTDLDPVLVGLSFKKQMYFVASEHVYRAGFASKLLKYVFSPIARQKGSTDAAAVMEIIKTLRAGANVCMFAEGNRSWNGVTGPISPATGKVVRMSGATLVTYRMQGGYLTTPRWSFTKRRGKMSGEVVNVYPPETLKAMSVNEVNAAIASDLYEDAFAREREQHTPFRGKRLAEGLDNVLFICPKCKHAQLTSNGDTLSCSCGLRVAYNEYGELTGSPYSLYEWDMWQKERLEEMVRRGEARFSSPDVTLKRIQSGAAEVPVNSGTLVMDRVRLRCGNTELALCDISDMAVNGRDMIVLTANDTQYEIRGRIKGALRARRYYMLFKAVKGEN